MFQRLRDLRYRAFYAVLNSCEAGVQRFGQQAPWHILPDLNADSVVYSAGVGHDISFEHELIHRFGCEVFLLDPSPTGIETMRATENRHPKLHFEAVALAARDGNLEFEPPLVEKEGSFRAAKPGHGSLTFPCKSLATLMREHGHDRIDLLKLDIEGVEYEVLENICEQRIPVRQICVEFHHSILPGIKRSETIRAILRLRKKGWRLIHHVNWDHTFLR